MLLTLLAALVNTSCVSLRATLCGVTLLKSCSGVHQLWLPPPLQVVSLTLTRHALGECTQLKRRSMSAELPLGLEEGEEVGGLGREEEGRRCVRVSVWETEREGGEGSLAARSFQGYGCSTAQVRP